MLHSEPRATVDPSRHVCWPRMRDYGATQPACMDCARQLVRIIHAPGHVVAGKVCTFPDTWRFCFLDREVDEAARKNLLSIPEWRRG